MPEPMTSTVRERLQAADTVVGEAGRGTAAALLEAGMNGDPDAWQEGLAMASGVELSEEERRRLSLVGGPPPVALDAVLRRLATPVRPHGHLGRLRLLAERYRLALDGDRDVLRWVEGALCHPEGSLGRADLLGPHGLPLCVDRLTAGLEPGELPADWLGRVGPAALADLCTVPEHPRPVWSLLGEVGEVAPTG